MRFERAWLLGQAVVRACGHLVGYVDIALFDAHLELLGLVWASKLRVL